MAQLPRETLAQALKDRHLLFLGNLLQLSTNESSLSSLSSRPGRPPTNCPGRRTNQLSGSAAQQAVRVGGPNVTADCPYPALRLDKLYAVLIRCLVLWTVTKQILVFLFKGLYLLAGGSDVTRGISCDYALH